MTSQEGSPHKDQPAKLNPPVFFTAAALLLGTVLFSVLAPDLTGELFKSLQTGITSNFGWFYILVVAIVLTTVALLCLSRYGDIKLGPDHATPDYSNTGWFAMLFSAGMGIGIMFFGVAEPVMHFMTPPEGDPNTVAAAEEAMRLTFFHWGLHAWGIYAIVAIILAYFSFRHNLPLTLRSALYPLIGERIFGPIGHAIDVFAIVGTTCGVATTLGIGVSQINAGLNYLFGLPVSVPVQVVLVVVTTCLATISVVTGLDRGIKLLSQLNLGLAALLLGLVLFLGPTVYLLQMFIQNTGGYLAELIDKTFNLYAYKPNDWIGGWTIFYWGWWMSWSPFVGLFIARISRGRTIRDFIIGAMFIPAGFTLFWMTVFGNSAVGLILKRGETEFGELVMSDQSVALFRFLEYFPMSSLLSMIAVIMVFVFFVTSADSGAMVVNMLASNGRDDTPAWQRIFWAASVGMLAIALLLAGGLTSLQTATIASALPFSIILLCAIFGLLKALRMDNAKREAQAMTTLAPLSANNPVSWEKRLHTLLQFPDKPGAFRYISKTVRPAMVSFAEELGANGVHAEVSKISNGNCRLEAYHGNEVDFVYEVRTRAHIHPGENLFREIDENDENSDDTYYRVEVHLSEGGQDYDIMGWSPEQVLNDLLNQYERHLAFLNMIR